MHGEMQPGRLLLLLVVVHTRMAPLQLEEVLAATIT